MKILFIGDIVGKIGRQAIALALPDLRKKYQPDVVVANVENLAHGKGITSKTLMEMQEAGIEIMTSGNHVWKKQDVTEAMNECHVNLITPANDPRTLDNHDMINIKIGSNNLSVINLLGRVFMEEEGLRCPFQEIDKILEDKIDNQDIILVDIHAEATSEKKALGWYLDGKVSAVLGTHTHIPTADAQILPQGTAYITDVGMVGPVDSVLGVKKELIIEKFFTDGPIVFKIPEEGMVEINAVLLEIDDQTKKAKSIERISQIIEIKK